MLRKEIIDFDKVVLALRSHPTMQKLEIRNSQGEGLLANSKCGKGKGNYKSEGRGNLRSKLRLKKKECFKTQQLVIDN